MEQPKWFHTGRDVKICDVVLFTKNEGSVVNTCQNGMVHEIELSREGLIRKLSPHSSSGRDTHHGRIGKYCYNK